MLSQEKIKILDYLYVHPDICIKSTSLGKGGSYQADNFQCLLRAEKGNEQSIPPVQSSGLDSILSLF